MRTIKTLDELTALVESSPRPLYVRYSRSVKGDVARGYSLNHQTGKAEPGLSVNKLAPEYWYMANAAQRGEGAQTWIAMQVRDYNYMRYQAPGTRAWVLTGTECAARGSDNELLLTDVAPVAYLSDACIEQACELDRAMAEAR